jgi:hypothetical protein
MRLADGYQATHVKSEWEWAARGGVRSKGAHAISGSDDLRRAVAWQLGVTAAGALVGLDRRTRHMARSAKRRRTS